MPQVKGRQTQKGTGRSRKKAPPPPPETDYDRVDASSVVFGLVMVLAVIVAGAALMGGSLAKVGDRFATAMDGVAGAAGFAVDDVQVVGLETDPTLESLVARMSEVDPGENMFRADPHAIRRRVVSTGQVTNARVYRLWPNQILIHASPAEAVALWHNGESWKVVDTFGHIMEGLDPKEHTSLLRLSGAEAPEGMPALIKALSRNKSIISEMSYAERVSKRRWDIKLKSGITIQLPADAKIDRAAARLATLEQTAELTARDISRIDLRVAGRAYLKPTRSAGPGSAPAES
ncbi:cell division protein FtsQ/DivIB [Henriciella sp.]|uniref:cell division protein FtsQ/DivIB n=1 Tax=Henriciella sp. TaxID=1968823 RepID=UPI002623F145|nr:cell division protein FtsQ/DivIB [Henriciella sp.]